MKHAFELDSVSFSYEGTFSLRDASLAIPEGAFSFVLGPNGAGKSTLFKLMSGILKPAGGEVRLWGDSVQSMKPQNIARKIAVVDQNPTYTFPFTVEEIVLMGRYPYGSNGLFESDEDIEKVEYALDVTHSKKFRSRVIQSLSGGERRRVEIARALAQEASIILLDEPASHLDIKQQRDLFALLTDLNTNKNVTLCVISHHIEYVRTCASHLFFMSNGAIEELHDRTCIDTMETLLEMF